MAYRVHVISKENSRAMNSAGGKSLILRIADSGKVIGLPATISGRLYELTAEALEPIQDNFRSRDEFQQFLREHEEAAVRAAEILCHIYHATHQEVKYLRFSRVRRREAGPDPAGPSGLHDEQRWHNTCFSYAHA